MAGEKNDRETVIEMTHLIAGIFGLVIGLLAGYGFGKHMERKEWERDILGE